MICQALSYVREGLFWLTPSRFVTQQPLHRPSPPRPANSVGCRGRVYLGNDGELWRSEADSSGVYRWRKISGEKKSPKKVKSKKQAIAIALSQAGMSKKKK